MKPSKELENLLESKGIENYNFGTNVGNFLKRSDVKIKDIEKYTEDEISSFSLFFEDMEENYQSSPEDFS